MRSRPPAPLAYAAALLAVLFLAGACGEPRAPGGSGALAPAGDGGVAVLRVAGSPYEMGWWQGYLLRDRILALHAAWEEALFAGVLGRPAPGESARAARASIETFCEFVLDQTLNNWLSESMRQELEGMASGCGLAKEKLLRVDVLRDALRKKGLDARLLGAAGLLPEGPGAYEARAWWSGPDTALLAGDWLVVERRPDGGPSSLVLSWPGSLGAVAGLRADGLAYLCGEGQVGDRRRMGFGGGRPFAVAAREAFEETGSCYDLVAQTNGTMGHCLLAASVHVRDDLMRVHGMAAFHVYSQDDPPWVIDRAPFLAVGPYERLDGPEAVALREAVGAPDPAAEERWLRLRGHADPAGAGGAALPGVSIRWRDGEGELEVALPGMRGVIVPLTRD